ncbi:MAG: hypothetical protein ACR2OD_03340 [Gaiellaceae bacterium]
MRNPFRTEREAFATVAIVGAVALAVGLAGFLGGGWAALSVFLALLVGLGISAYALGMGSRAEVPLVGTEELAGPSADGRKRLLVIANETLVGDALHAEIQHRLKGRRGTVFVVAPVLTSRLRHWTSDTDGASEDARDRLDRSLAALEAEQIDASGRIGDGEPLQALEDALREFPADEVIVSTHPPQRSNWLEARLVPEARTRFPLPITHVVVDLEHEQAHVEEDTKPGTQVAAAPTR